MVDIHIAGCIEEGQGSLEWAGSDGGEQHAKCGKHSLLPLASIQPRRIQFDSFTLQ
jgi:hypothetical protein